MAKKDEGLIDKYIVNRADGRDGPGSKHYRCALFVLDLTHDYHARQVLYGYAARIQNKKPQLAKDLFFLLEELDHAESTAEVEALPEHDGTDINIDIPDIGEKFDKEALSRLLADVLSTRTFEVETETRTRTLFECAICDSPLGRPLGLIGGFNTVLCGIHANAWHVFIDRDPLYRLLDICRIDRDLAIAAGDRSAALVHQKLERDTRGNLFDTGEEWVRTEAEEYQKMLAKARIGSEREQDGK